MIIMDADHPDVLEFVNVKARENKRAKDLLKMGYDITLNGVDSESLDFQNANNSVRVSDEFMQAVEEDREWKTRYVTNGEVCETFKARDLLRMIAEGTYFCGDPGMQFDTTINEWHTCPETDRIYASNPCSEYMFLNDSACNLASINLMKFLREDGEFDVVAYRAAVRTLISAQEIIVDNASYPTEAIGRNSQAYRPLGLGYANLGALLMSLGLPYDSDGGRALAAGVTAVMRSPSMATSARWAGPPVPSMTVPLRMIRSCATELLLDRRPR